MGRPLSAEQLEAVPSHPVALTASEITGLVGLFQTMLDRTEARIIGRLDANASGAAERWAKHDAEALEERTRTVARFESVESDVRTHLKQAHDRDIIARERLRTITGPVSWLWAHWRDVVLLLIGLIALGTFVVESANRWLGGHP